MNTTHHSIRTDLPILSIGEDRSNTFRDIKERNNIARRLAGRMGGLIELNMISTWLIIFRLTVTDELLLAGREEGREGDDVSERHLPSTMASVFVALRSRLLLCRDWHLLAVTSFANSDTPLMPLSLPLLVPLRVPLPVSVCARPVVCWVFFNAELFCVCVDGTCCMCCWLPVATAAAARRCWLELSDATRHGSVGTAVSDWRWWWWWWWNSVTALHCSTSTLSATSTWSVISTLVLLAWLSTT